MAAPRKPLNDRMAGEIMLNEVFKVVQRLNAIAGPGMVTRGKRTGNMTFSPKSLVDEDKQKQYACYVEIYTKQKSATEQQISMEWSGADVEQFKQALATIFPAFAGLAKEGYVSDMFTVGLIKPDSEKVEGYAPKALEPGMYGLHER